jgi:hypothetical protein
LWLIRSLYVCSSWQRWGKLHICWKIWLLGDGSCCIILFLISMIWLYSPEQIYLVFLCLDSSGLRRHTRHNLKLPHLLSFHLTSFTLEFGTPTRGVSMSQTWIGRTWVLQNWLTMTVTIFAGVWWSLMN